MDYLDKLETIMNGYDDEYSWVDQTFVDSLYDQIDSGQELTEKQKEAIDNIYDKGNS